MAEKTESRRRSPRHSATIHDVARLAGDVVGDLRRSGEPLLAEVFTVIDRHRSCGKTNPATAPQAAPIGAPIKELTIRSRVSYADLDLATAVIDLLSGYQIERHIRRERDDDLAGVAQSVEIDAEPLGACQQVPDLLASEHADAVQLFAVCTGIDFEFTAPGAEHIECCRWKKARAMQAICPR